MDRLSISQRLYLSTAACIAVIAVLAYFFVNSVASNVDFAKQEKLGNQYQRPLTAILSALVDYRIIIASGNEQEEKRLALLNSKAAEISNSFTELGKIDTQIGASLQFTKEGLGSRGRDSWNFKDVNGKWQAVAASSANLSADELEAKTKEVIVDIRGMIQHMGDTSNLVLDPDLDSYYLMDVTLLALPQTIDRIGEAASFALRVRAQAEIAETDKNELLRLANMLKEADLARVLGDFDTAYKEDANYYGTSESFKTNTNSRKDSYQQANEALITILQDLAANKETATYEALQNAATAASASAYDLWKASVEEMDIMLAARIDSYEQHIKIVMAYVAAGLFAALAFFYFVTRSIKKPLAEVQKSMQDISGGNLECLIPHLNKRDEIGAMAKALKVFQENALERVWLEEESRRKDKAVAEERKTMIAKLASDFESGVHNIITTVASASTQLCRTAENMQKLILNVNQQSNTASSNSFKALGNVQSVSAAVEEMSASVKEISSQISKSSVMVSSTVERTRSADNIANSLSTAVDQISGILQMIQDIAGQINLLALNATIESARAGEAGKGFAVVASEVKNLASQTTKATEEIAKQIENVQSSSNDVLSVLRGIQESISSVNEYSSVIASAVEEQSAVTMEISSNMQHTSNEVQGITDNISYISKGVNDADNAAREVLSAAEMLSKQSEMLNSQVKLFLQKMVA